MILSEARKIANIDSLVGRHFVAKSGAVGRIERLAAGAIRVHWQGGEGRREEENREDEREILEWIEMVLGVPLDPTEHRDRATEKEALARWQKR